VAVALAPFEEDDVDRLLAWVETDADLLEWAGFFIAAPLTRDKLLRYQARAANPAERCRIFRAENPATGDVVGHAELSHIWPHLSARISRVLVAPEMRGRGIGTEIVMTVRDLAFAEHGVHRVDLGVASDNAPAIACYRKAGFVPVGLWPDAMETSAGPIDVQWMTAFRDGRA